MKAKRNPGGPVQPRVMAALKEATKPLSPNDLCQLLDLKAGTINCSMRYLVQKRLVKVVKVSSHPFYSLPDDADDLGDTLPGARLVRLSDRNMQPANEPLRRFSRGGLACSLGMI